MKVCRREKNEKQLSARGELENLGWIRWPFKKQKKLGWTVGGHKRKGHGGVAEGGGWGSSTRAKSFQRLVMAAKKAGRCVAVASGVAFERQLVTPKKRKMPQGTGDA